MSGYTIDVPMAVLVAVLAASLIRRRSPDRRGW